MSSVNPTIYQAPRVDQEQTRQTSGSAAPKQPTNIFAQANNTEVAGAYNLFSSAQSNYQTAASNLNSATETTNSTISRFNAQSSNTNAASVKYQSASSTVNNLNEWIDGLDKELGQTRASLTNIVANIQTTTAAQEKAKADLTKVISDIATLNGTRTGIINSQNAYNSAVSQKPVVRSSITSLTASIASLTTSISDIDKEIQDYKGGKTTAMRPATNPDGSAKLDADGNPVLEEVTLAPAAIAQLIKDLEASKKQMENSKRSMESQLENLEGQEQSLDSTISAGGARNFTNELNKVNSDIAALQRTQKSLEAELNINLEKLGELTNEELNFMTKAQEQNTALVGLNGQLITANGIEADAKVKYESEDDKLDARQNELTNANEEQTTAQSSFDNAKTTFESAYAQLQRMLGQNPENSELGVA